MQDLMDTSLSFVWLIHPRKFCSWSDYRQTGQIKASLQHGLLTLYIQHWQPHSSLKRFLANHSNAYDARPLWKRIVYFTISKALSDLICLRRPWQRCSVFGLQNIFHWVTEWKSGPDAGPWSCDKTWAIGLNGSAFHWRCCTKQLNLTHV